MLALRGCYEHNTTSPCNMYAKLEVDVTIYIPTLDPMSLHIGSGSEHSKKDTLTFFRNSTKLESLWPL